MKVCLSVFLTINTALQAGYRPGFDIVGAPFDFRLASPDSVLSNGQFDNLRALIEKVVRVTGRKAHLWGHSLGAPYAARFLSTFVSKEWKSKYIASLISFGGPFAGSPSGL